MATNVPIPIPQPLAQSAATPPPAATPAIPAIQPPIVPDAITAERGFPAPQDEPLNPALKFQSAPQMMGRTAQVRASRDAFFNNLSQSVNYFVNQHKVKQIRLATVDVERLTGAQTTLSDPSATPQAKVQAQAVVQDILGDPKKLKLMAKALNYDFMNPGKDSDNAYKRAIHGVVNAKNPAAQQQAQAALQQYQANQAKQMTNKLPTEPISMAQVQQAIMSKLSNGQRLTQLEQQAIRLGPNPNTLVNASERLAAARLAAQTEAQKIEIGYLQYMHTYHLKSTQFDAAQALKEHQFNISAAIKLKQLNVAKMNAQTAAERAQLTKSAQMIQKNASVMDSINKQITSYRTQEKTLVAAIRQLVSKYTHTSNIVSTTILGKTVGVTKAAQTKINNMEQQINTIEDSIKKLSDAQAKVMSNMSSINTNAFTPTGTPQFNSNVQPQGNGTTPIPTGATPAPAAISGSSASNPADLPGF